MAARLTGIGYWPGEGPGPDPRSMVDEDWDEDERQAVSDYVGQGFFFRGFTGATPCVLCTKRNGSGEFTDGVYAWPEGLGHYIDAHDVRLPQEFVDHVLARQSEWDEAEVDDSWWRSQ